MAGLLSNPVGSASQGLTATYLGSLINQIMAVERRPLVQLQAQRDQIQVQSQLYSDARSLLTSLKSLALDLAGGSSSSVFGAKSASSSDTTVITASASPSAAVGTYDVVISANGLAKSHRVASDVQATSSALGLSGTFVIGGRASGAAAISNANTTATITGFAEGAIQSGQAELASDKYYVETRNNAGTWEFRLLDGDGKAMSISSSADGSGELTSAWVAFTAGATYQTGRGLDITFGASPASGSKDAGTAASLNYTALGASITVSTSTTLEGIRDAINNATYVSGNSVSASIVGSQLVLTAGRTGSQHGIQAADTSGTVLQSLGVLTVTGSFKNVLQTALDADFSVNGIAFTRGTGAARSSNTIDNVISGVTLSLLKETTSSQTVQVTVGADNSTVMTKLTDFLNKVNEVVDFIRNQSAVNFNAGTNTYTPGGLSGDTVFTRLRADLVSALAESVSGQAADQPKSLADIGITMGTGLHFSISDSSKLTTALSTDYQGVASLVDKVMDRLYDSSSATGVLAPFVTYDDSGLLTSKINANSARTERLSSQISQLEARLQQREDALTDEFGRLLSQVTWMNAQRAYAAVIFTQNLYG